MGIDDDIGFAEPAAEAEATPTGRRFHMPAMPAMPDLSNLPVDLKLYGQTVGGLCLVSVLLLFFSAVSINSQNAIKASDNHFTAPLSGRAALMPQGKADLEAEKKAEEEALAAEQAAAEQEAAESKIVDVVPGLQEETAYGSLPVRGKGGETAFQAYQAPKPAAVLPGVPRVALAFTNFGLSEKLSAEAVAELPAGSSLVLSPYATGDVPAMVHAARVKGHEIWLDVPLPASETTMMADTGPLTLQEKLDDNANRKRLLTVMGTSTGYVGLFVSNPGALQESVMFKNVVAGTAMERGVALAVAGTPAQLGGPGILTGVQIVPMTGLSSQQSLLANMRALLNTHKDTSVQVYTLPLNLLAIKAARAFVEDMAVSKSGTFLPLSAVIPRDGGTSDASSSAEVPKAPVATAPAQPHQDLLTE